MARHVGRWALAAAAVLVAAAVGGVMVQRWARPDEAPSPDPDGGSCFDPPTLERLRAEERAAGVLGSLAVDGRELHPSLRTPRLDAVRDLPAGVAPADNPQRSGDDAFVRAIARNSSQGRLGSEGVRSALYARYAAGDQEVGVYGLAVEPGPAADRRENALREIWAYNDRVGRARVHRNGSALVVVWHSGVTPECWEAVNTVIAARLAAP